MVFRLAIPLLCFCISACSHFATNPSLSQQQLNQQYFHDSLFGKDSTHTIQDIVALYSLPDRIKQELDHQVVPLSNPLARLAALRQWVYEEIGKYEYDAGTTVSLDQLETARKINCLSFSVLFQAAADYANVPAETHLIETEPSWDIQKQTWVYMQHISVISTIQGFYSLQQLQRIAGIHINGRQSDIEALQIKASFIIDINPEIIEMPPDSVELSRQQVLARYYSNKSAEALVSQDLKKAYYFSKHALTVDPKSAEAWNNLGVIYGRISAIAAARDAYLQAINLNSNILSAKNNLYAAYMLLGQQQEARKLFSDVDKHWHKNPYYHYNLGETSAAMGDYAKAIEHFKTAIRFKDDERQFYLALAKAQMALDQRSLAQFNLEKAASLSDTITIDAKNADHTLLSKI